MIRELTIKNYKSILDHTIELGRINVFIGENGCGKTNILEAVAMGAAALTDKLSVEEFFCWREVEGYLVEFYAQC
jgi:AAA15 family ATPase/GTPase